MQGEEQGKREDQEPQASAGEQPEAAAESTGDGAEAAGENPILGEEEPLELPQPELSVELEEARAEAEKYREQALRVAAEAQNIRHRAERDVEKAHKFALEKFAAELLPVIDSLEHAIAAADPANESLKPMLEGLELTHKMFIDTLARFNVECVDPQGEPFNPEFHEAMSMLESAEVAPNTVLQVYQKGYVLNGRLVRAAKVVVARAPAASQVDERA